MNKDTNRYGDLLNKYMNGAHADYRTKKEMEQAEKDRYGNLLDNAKPNHKVYEDMIAVDNACREMNQRRTDAYEQENTKRQKRIEREKREHEERVARNNAFVNDFLEKKESERKAAEEKRKEAEREQNMLDSIQKVINIRDETSAMVARTKAMLAKDEEQRKAHNEKMKWYDSQKKYLGK